MNEMIGHTRYDDDGKLVEKETLKEHSGSVGNMCESFGEETGMGLVCKLLGDAHDMGKATDIFGKRVGVIDSNGEDVHYAHQMAGALYMLRLFGDTNLGRMMASIIAGHHGGLRNWAQLPSSETDKRFITADNTFKTMEREYLNNVAKRPDYQVYPEVYEMIEELTGCLDIDADTFDLNPKFEHNRTTDGKDRYFSSYWAMLTRLNHSRLVDSDCLCTEAWYDKSAPSRRNNNHASLKDLRKKLDTFIRKHCKNDTVINQWRSNIMSCAKKAAPRQPGLFTMEADVGGGKTLAMLAFALLHATNNGMRRVIYLAPFGSIIEQTANLFKKIFGENNVCVHHMNMDTTNMSTESLMACENWDAPIVVSSVEQMFDSLYTNRNNRCRKIHNLARSVILVDEFHDIPMTKMWHVTHAINALTHDRLFKSSLVLASATLPVINGLKITRDDGTERALVRLHPTEIVPAKYFSAPKKRVEITYDSNIGGEGNWKSVANAANQHKQCMVIVNTRASAYELTKCLADMGVAHVEHLSASLTPEHREHVLSRVNTLLEKGKPIILVCTSIVQTGVDISFPYVYRERCGWTALMQASGRCNRNGELELGHCIMFAKTGDDIPGLPTYQTSAMMYLLPKSKFNPELVSKESYWKAYVNEYKRMCKSGKRTESPFDNNGVERYEVRDNDISFDTISGKARIIDDGQQEIIVMNEKSKQLISQLESYYALTDEELSKKSSSAIRKTRRLIQRYSVQCYGKSTKTEDEQKSLLGPWLVQNGYAHIVNGIENVYILDKGYDPKYGIAVLQDQFTARKKR